MANVVLLGGLGIGKSLHTKAYYGEQLINLNGEHVLLRIAKGQNGVIGNAKKAKVSEINGHQMVAVEWNMMNPKANELVSIEFGKMRLTKEKIQPLMDELIEELKKAVL